jgi:Fic family protein
MDKLIKWYDRKKDKTHPVELAAEFHVRFEAIHPFTDGNGRVGREIFNLMICGAGYPPFNFDVKFRDEYLDELEMAQKGDLSKINNYILDHFIDQMRLRLRRNPMKDVFA